MLSEEIWNMLEKLRQYRRDLHRIPEIMFELPKTRKYILEALAKTRAHVQETELGGVIAYFDNGADYTMAFRADMDALTVTEQTDVDFASEHEGCMHACGHDAHMAMLLTLCDWVNEHAGELRCNVMAVFQPAEENGGGAEHIARSGILERYNVSGIYALHVDPAFEEGVIATRAGAFMAKSSDVTITVHAKASHAAEWHNGIDSMEAAAELYLNLLAMERSIDAEIPRLLKFGTMKSGTAQNVISDKTVLCGTMRAFSMDTFDWMKQQTFEMAKKCEEKFGVRIEIDIPGGYPPLINSDVLYEKAKDALAGFHFYTMPKPEMLAEDFAFYLEAAPALMMKVGVGGSAKLHSPKLMFREEPLLEGARALIALAKKG
jgi:hippurate hydrolase